MSKFKDRTNSGAVVKSTPTPIPGKSFEVALPKPKK